MVELPMPDTPTPASAVDAAAQAATLRREGAQAVLSLPSGELRLPWQDIEWPERGHHRARTAHLKHGGSLHSKDGPTWDHWLQAQQVRESWVVRAQQSWRATLVAVIALLLTGTALYQWGLPLVSRGVLTLVPTSVDQQIGVTTLEGLDGHMLRPTRLPAEDQARIQSAFQQALERYRHTPTHGQRALTPAALIFRSSRIGPNAFALPGGTIVMTDELVELARLKRHLDPRAVVRPLYELALERSAEHPGALRGLAQCLPDGDRAAKLACLHRLWDAGSNDRWWAARTALAELETPRIGYDHDAAAFKQWRKRLERAQESEERAWEELSNASYFSHIARNDLSEFELGEFQAELARCAPVACAWLVRKNLREHPQRRAYLLFVELPGMDDEDRYDLCRWLERTLSLPGPLLVLWAGESPTLKEIKRSAFDPIYTR